MNSKIFITALMLLAFVGQSIAVAAIPCNLGDPITSKVNLQTEHGKTDHSKHGMNNQSQVDLSNQIDDCCIQSDGCSMAGCISLAFPTYFIQLEHSIPSFKIAISPINLNPNRTITSLYRPPILS